MFVRIGIKKGYKEESEGRDRKCDEEKRWGDKV
jgi:hypothetical protein